MRRAPERRRSAGRQARSGLRLFSTSRVCTSPGSTPSRFCRHLTTLRQPLCWRLPLFSSSWRWWRWTAEDEAHECGAVGNVHRIEIPAREGRGALVRAGTRFRAGDVKGKQRADLFAFYARREACYAPEGRTPSAAVASDFLTSGITFVP